MTESPSEFPRLARLGWNANRARAFLGAAPDDRPGRVIEDHGNRVVVATETGDLGVELAGALEDRPMVGDWVTVGANERVVGVFPRAGTISRKVAGRESREQILAANVDRALIVTVNDRDFSPRRIERYLIAAWEGGAEPALVVNKVDLHPVDLALNRELGAIALGVPIAEVSATADIGLDDLRSLIPPGSTAVLLGSSGVGKSTLTNALMDDPTQRIGVLGTAGRGRHTTTHRALFELGHGGLIIDTPGLREFHPWSSEAGVRAAFEDVEELAQGCRFGDCQHAGEPGCAVVGAVAEVRLPAERLASFHALLAEQRALAARDGGAAGLERKRTDRIAGRAVRAHIKRKYGPDR